MIARNSVFFVLAASFGNASVGFAQTPARAIAPPAAEASSSITSSTRRLPIDAGGSDSILRPPTLQAVAPPAARTPAGDSYAEREKTARNVETFRGGEGVSIYIGGGVLTAIVIVALVIILL